jgi:hypothetical protein
MDFEGDICDSCVLIFNYFSQKREGLLVMGFEPKTTIKRVERIAED